MFIFFIELALLFVVITILKKKGIMYALLIGMSTGLAVLSKWSPALLVFPVWFIAELMAGKRPLKDIVLNIFIATLACAIVVAPWIMHILKAFPEEARWVLQKFIFAYSTPVEEHTGPVWFYFQTLGMVFGEIAWIPLLMALFFLIKRKAGWEVALLTSWWIIPFVLFSFAATKRHTYVLLFAPAVFILISHYWFFLLEKIKKPKKQWWIILILALLIILPVRYTFERTKLFQKVERGPDRVTRFKQLKDFQGPDNIIYFNEKHNIEGMFYTNFIMYDYTPPETVLDSLERAGHTVIVKE